MKGRVDMIVVLTVMLVSMIRAPARKLSSGVTTLTLAGIVLLVVAGGASANCVCDDGWCDNVDRAYYQCGETVTESCTFDANMDCPPGHGLIVGAEGITISGSNNCYALIGSSTTCAAFEDEGMPESCDCGILSTGGIDNVVIKNLEVQGFCNGIVVKGVSPGNGADNNTIECCEVHDNGVDGSGVTHGIIVLCQAHENTVTKCDVYNNTGKATGGCGLGGSGIRVFKVSHDNYITCNNISSNEGAGFYSKRGCWRGHVEYNHIWNNGVNITIPAYDNRKDFQGGGIRLECKTTNDWVVDYNNVHDNIGPGMFIRGQRDIIRHNTVTNNTNGTYADATLRACDVATLRGCGIILHPDGGPSELYNNTFCNNEMEDIYVCEGHEVINDSNTCDWVVDLANDPPITCEWDCTNLTTVYYDYDQDDVYAAADCSCLSQCECDVGSCCNPGLFDWDGTFTKCAGGECVLVPGADTNDCCYDGDKPNLVITDVTLSGTQPVSVTYTVTNQGINTACPSTTLITTSYGSEFRIDSVPELLGGGGASYEGTVDGLTCPCGTTLTVKVTADICDCVDESNEKDNDKSKQQTCFVCPVAINVSINTGRYDTGGRNGLAEEGKVNISWENPPGTVPDIYVYDKHPCEGGTVIFTKVMEHTDPPWWHDNPDPINGSDPYMVNGYTGAALIDHLYDQVENQTRYYAVVPRPAEGGPYPPQLPQVGKVDVHLESPDALISLPCSVNVTDINEVLRYSHWPGVRLEGYNTPADADRVFTYDDEGAYVGYSRLRANGVWTGSSNLQSNRAFVIWTEKGLFCAPNANMTLRMRFV